jgi:broad specificity phosphatase PhoE
LKETTLYFIRHGEISANVERLWHGSTDSELNELGMQQARNLGEFLQKGGTGISAIYASPLKRTMKTAELVGNPIGLEPRAANGLVEFGIGELEGTPYLVLAEELGFFEEIEADLHFSPPGGESVIQVAARMVTAISDIAECHPGEEVAIVSHGAAMGIALAQILEGRPYPFYQYHMDNTGLSKFRWADGLEMIFFNQVEHLQELAF